MMQIRGLAGLVLLALLQTAGAESWMPLGHYVDLCSLIVKAKTVVAEDKTLTFEVLETWKGSFDPKEFVRIRGERFLARAGEHGVEVTDGQGIVFFFVGSDRDDKGRYHAHSTSFPIKDEKLVYAATSEAPQPFTTAAFKRAILQRSSPKGIFPFAISPDGRYRLRIVNIERHKTEGKPDAAAIQCNLEIIDPREPAKAKRWDANEILFEHQNPIVAARTAKGVELEVKAHHWSWGTATGLIAVHDFEIPSDVKRLASLRIRCDLSRVTNSKKLVFKDLKHGECDELRCGPFELIVNGEDEQVAVTAAAFDIHEADHKAFFERVPIRGLHHRWAVDAVRLTDAKDNPLVVAGRSGSGGHSTGLFHPAGAFFNPGKIAYPLKLTLHLPQKFKRERVEFEFRNLVVERIELPAPR